MEISQPNFDDILQSSINGIKIKANDRPEVIEEDLGPIKPEDLLPPETTKKKKAKCCACCKHCSVIFIFIVAIVSILAATFLAYLYFMRPDFAEGWSGENTAVD
jgi:hypothetical protein